MSWFFNRDVVKQIWIAVFKWAHHIPQLLNPDTSQLWMAPCSLQGRVREELETWGCLCVFPSAVHPTGGDAAVSTPLVLSCIFKVFFHFMTSFSPGCSGDGSEIPLSSVRFTFGRKAWDGVPGTLTPHRASHFFQSRCWVVEDTREFCSKVPHSTWPHLWPSVAFYTFSAAGYAFFF